MAGWWFSPGISDSSSIKTDGWMVGLENHQPAISFNGREIRSTRRKTPASHQF
jgi:hypothetical protein